MRPPYFLLLQAVLLQLVPRGHCWLHIKQNVQHFVVLPDQLLLRLRVRRSCTVSSFKAFSAGERRSFAFLAQSLIWQRSEAPVTIHNFQDFVQQKFVGGLSRALLLLLVKTFVARFL